METLQVRRFAITGMMITFTGGKLKSFAGGNLALGVLSHVLHPHPKISPLSLAAPLKGAVLLAPWVSFRTDWPSNNSNKNKDIITKTTGDSWSASYLGTAIKDEYNEPFERTDDQWWSRLQEIVGEIFVVGASDEVLLDSIQAMGKKLQVSIAVQSQDLYISILLPKVQFLSSFLRPYVGRKQLTLRYLFTGRTSENHSPYSSQ